MIEGAVDEVTVAGAVGWLGEKTGGTPLSVVVVLYERVIAEAAASIHRPDLAQVGFNEGRCGFEVQFAERLADRDLAFVKFFPKNSQLLLPRSRPEPFADPLLALSSEFPAAGRSRSLLGGLWTDRTDALAAMGGRARAGLFDTITATALRAFIADGFVEFDAGERTPPPGLGERLLNGLAEDRVAFAQTLGAYAFPVPTLAFLRAAFDDLPAFYLPGRVEANATFAQASAFEAMSAPAEMALAYVVLDGPAARFDYVTDSHELPEFAADGRSRWAPGGVGALELAESSQRPVRSARLEAGNVLIVGPGLVHRIALPEGAIAARLVLSPQRVAPLRFLRDDWLEASIGPEWLARL